MKTLDQILETLDNLATSWKTLGHPTQAKVQAEAMQELRAALVDKPDQPKRRR